MAETNREFANYNKAFRQACKAADLEPTKRQAAKWRKGRGKAYAAK